MEGIPDKIQDNTRGVSCHEGGWGIVRACICCRHILITSQRSLDQSCAGPNVWETPNAPPLWAHLHIIAQGIALWP